MSDKSGQCDDPLPDIGKYYTTKGRGGEGGREEGEGGREGGEIYTYHNLDCSHTNSFCLCSVYVVF